VTENGGGVRDSRRGRLGWRKRDACQRGPVGGELGTRARSGTHANDDAWSAHGLGHVFEPYLTVGAYPSISRAVECDVHEPVIRAIGPGVGSGVSGRSGFGGRISKLYELDLAPRWRCPLDEREAIRCIG